MNHKEQFLFSRIIDYIDGSDVREVEKEQDKGALRKAWDNLLLRGCNRVLL